MLLSTAISAALAQVQDVKKSFRYKPDHSTVLTVSDWLGWRMAEDDVLQKAKELLERSAALERELEQFYQREAEQGREAQVVFT
ncbi:hypothetical protein [Deinococcus sp. QL22]|uniref:hypothetical protein n=1 Tax=Deinococcus sp. QL22 TaxID=2939437 RepID=UPI0020174E4A|nr:hypothetical protein [Deinococcus sp. QL22]UQN09261.1 hypothetical protein M1R55_22045 [Deinococcus sp. QL22]